MKLIYGERELVMEFRENQVQVAVVENQEYFSILLENLYRQSIGGEGKFIFSEGDKILSLEKQAEIIWNPFSIDMNNKKYWENYIMNCKRYRWRNLMMRLEI